MNTEEKRRIGYIKREDYPGTIEHCSRCAYAYTKMGDPDVRPCSKHNMMVDAWDVCNEFEDWCEVTEEGRRWRALIQKRAELLLKAKEEKFQKPKENDMITEKEEKNITTPWFAVIGSLLGGTMFNLVFAFIAYKTGLIEWGIKQCFFTYVVAAIIVGVGNFILGVLAKE